MSATGQMIRHIVLIKFREDAPEELRQELVRLSQWGRDADYVSGYVCGWGIQPNLYSGAGEEWDWGMSLDMAEQDAKRYAEDPTHVAIPQEVIDCAEKFAVLDFRIE
jgi:hypothetical protein